MSEEQQDESETVVKVKTEVYSRIVGYIRPLSSWHDSKRQEFHDRRTFTVPQRREDD